MARTAGSGWGGGPILYQPCPKCGKKKCYYDPIHGAEWHEPFKCTYCKERSDSDILLRYKHPPMTPTVKKAMVLENGLERDIPESLIRYLKEKNIKWEWFDMRQRFWPENREETVKYFSNLPAGQEMYCDTVFDGFGQLELMILLLDKLKNKHFTLKIMHPRLCAALLEYAEKKESDITPKEYEKELERDDLTNAEYKIVMEKIHAFKEVMNKKLKDVLMFHKIYSLGKYGKEIHLTSWDVVVANKNN